MDLAFRRWCSPRVVLGCAVVACVGLVYFYPLTLRAPLLDPDEGLHASIAQEMVEHGDYLVPRFCGEPFRDKPIVYFLAEAASLRLFGMNEAAVRLPGVLFSLAGCLTTALLAWRLYDREVAAYALAAALTLVLPVMLTQSPAHDIALVPAINLLALCFWEQERATTRGGLWRWLIGGVFCVAMALLTKGLIGVAVFAVGIGLYAVATRSLTWRLAARSAFVLACGAVLASPWFLIMESASPGYLKYYFIERHLMGFLTEGETHGKAAWYYYVAPVLGGAMPWLLYSMATVWQLRQDDRRTRESRATILMAAWFVGGFLFLSTANSKLLTYSLPLFPPLAILAGVAFARFFRGTLAPLVRLAVAMSFRLACLFGIFGPVVTLMVFDYFLDAPSPLSAYALAVTAGLVIGAAWLTFERGRHQMAMAVGMFWFPILFVALANGPFLLCAERHSQQSLAEAVAAMNPRPERIVMIGEETGSLMFYLPRDARTWYRAGRIQETDGRTLDRLAVLPGNWIVAIKDKELDRTSYADEVRRLAPGLVGNFRIVVPAKVDLAKFPNSESILR